MAMKKAAVIFLALVIHSAAYGDGDVEAGRAVFSKTCAGCHRIGPGAQAGFAPQLNSIFGRHAGSTTDYQYSDEMKASGIVWNRENLNAFIKEPSDVVPGTKMHFWGISDARQREDVLAYLQANQ